MIITNNLTIQNNAKSQNLAGYKGIEAYGTERNRKAMEHKVTLTPEKIDSIMRSAKTTDEGLIEVYKLLNAEFDNTSEAFRSINVIIKHYITLAKQRQEEILAKRPYGSKIPVIGLLFDTTAARTGLFQKRIQRYTNDLVDDFNEIVNTHFHKQLNTIVTDYKAASDHYTNGLDYLCTVNQSTPLRTKLKETAIVLMQRNQEHYNSLSKNLTSLQETLTKMTEEIIVKQNKSQLKRIVIKGAIKIITVGLA